MNEISDETLAKVKALALRTVINWGRVNADGLSPNTLLPFAHDVRIAKDLAKELGGVDFDGLTEGK